MPLPIAEFMMLAASCAPGVAPETLRDIAKTESAFDVLVIHDNTTGKSHRPADRNEAVALTKQLLSADHSVDAGVMQINSRNFNWLGLTAESAFDPCVSIKAGAAILTAYSAYNTGSPRRGFDNGYVQRVVGASRNTKGVIDGSTPKPPEVKSAKSEWTDIGDTGDLVENPLIRKAQR